MINKEPQMVQSIPQDTVKVDVESGEWIGKPEYVMDVNFGEWCAKEDTDNCHYDTYQYYGKGLGEMGDALYPDGQTRAIEMVWVNL